MTGSTNASERQGALTQYLDQSTPEFEDALEIEAAFSIDRGFPATRNLVTVLLDHLKDESLDDDRGTGRRKRWHATLALVESRASRSGWKLAAPTSRGGNPLGNQFSRYAVAAVFLQPISVIADTQLKGLIKICLCALLSNPTISIEAEATSLRLFIAKTGVHSPLFSQLPNRKDFPGFRDGLYEMLPTLKLSSLSNVEQNLVRTMKKLLRQSPKRRKTDPQTKLERNRVKGWKRLELIDNLSVDRLPGLLATLSPHPDDGESGEPTETPTFFIEHEPPQDEEQKNLPPSLAHTDAAAQESRHWLSRHQRLVPSDLGRFTPLERKHLARSIYDGLNSLNARRQLSAGILGLMYCTASDLDRVASFTIGEQGDLNLRGYLRRLVRRPTNAFKPPASSYSVLIESQEYLDLPLPQPLGEWIKANFDHPCSSLLTALGIPQAKLKENVTEYLKEIRSHSRFQRIRLERIPAALPIEVTLATHNPAITFILAGNPNQAAPMLSYYTNYPTKHLVDIYKCATTRLMEV